MAHSISRRIAAVRKKSMTPRGFRNVNLFYMYILDQNKCEVYKSQSSLVTDNITFKHFTRKFACRTSLPQTKVKHLIGHSNLLYQNTYIIFEQNTTTQNKLVGIVLSILIYTDLEDSEPGSKYKKAITNHWFK